MMTQRDGGEKLTSKKVFLKKDWSSKRRTFRESGSVVSAHYGQQEVKLTFPPSLLILLSGTFTFPDFQARQRECQRGNGKMRADK